MEIEIEREKPRVRGEDGEIAGEREEQARARTRGSPRRGSIRTAWKPQGPFQGTESSKYCLVLMVTQFSRFTKNIYMSI